MLFQKLKNGRKHYKLLTLISCKKKTYKSSSQYKLDHLFLHTVRWQGWSDTLGMVMTLKHTQSTSSVYSCLGLY